MARLIPGCTSNLLLGTRSAAGARQSGAGNLDAIAVEEYRTLAPSAGTDVEDGDNLVAPTPPILNRRGQVLGRKGLRTRAGIIDETVGLLETLPAHQITMAAVTKRLDLDAAAFYLYFEDIGDVLIAALGAVADDLAALIPILSRAWARSETFERAFEFVDAYHDVWVRHAMILRARNVLSDTGDARFLEARMSAAQPLAFALSDKLEAHFTVEDPHPVSPFGMASLLIMAVERASTISAQRVYEDTVAWSDYRVGLARMIEAALVGPGSQT
jgi:AcrR family transcriptional regulator